MKKQHPTDEYGSIAPWYDLVVSPALREVRRDIAAYIRFRRFRRVVDVCCGTGEQLRHLHGSDMVLYGLDNSLGMLEQAHAKSAGDISFHLLDIEQDVLAQTDFDCAILSFALHEKHPAMHQTIFFNTCRMVRPGGAVIIADYGRVAESFAAQLYGRWLIPLIERLAGAEHYRNYRRWMAAGALEGFLRNRGLESDIICRACAKCLLCCAIEIVEPGLTLQQSLRLLNQALIELAPER